MRILIIIWTVILGFGLFPKYVNAGLNDGLVAYWSFDNCDAKDDSGNGHDGEIFGEPQCIDGVKGKAFHFSGSNYIEIPYSSDLAPSSYTAVVFYQADDVNVLGEPLIKGIDKHYYQIQYGSKLQGQENTIEFWYEDSTDADYYIISEEGHDTDVHMAVQILQKNLEGCTLTAYIDDKKVEEKVFDSCPYDNMDGVYIAKGNNGYFKGMIDEVRIYNRALSSSEISSLYAYYTACDSSDVSRYEEGFEEGYNKGFEEGKNYCKLNPSDCGIEATQKEPPSECTSLKDSCKASFNMFTNTLHVPCLDMGKSYWLDLELINSEPVQLELKGFGEN